MPSSNESIYIDWEFILGEKDLIFTGDHTVLVRAVDSNSMHSISAHTEFYAYGKTETSTDNFMAITVVLGILVAVVAIVTAYRNKLFNN